MFVYDSKQAYNDCAGFRPCDYYPAPVARPRAPARPVHARAYPPAPARLNGRRIQSRRRRRRQRALQKMSATPSGSRPGLNCEDLVLIRTNFSRRNYAEDTRVIAAASGILEPVNAAGGQGEDNGDAYTCDDIPTWICSVCTFVNRWPEASVHCSMCQTQNDFCESLDAKNDEYNCASDQKEDIVQEAVWFWKKNRNAADDDLEAWVRFTDEQTTKLEQAYRHNNNNNNNCKATTTTGTDTKVELSELYAVDLKQMTQLRKQSPFSCRKVKRQMIQVNAAVNSDDSGELDAESWPTLSSVASQTRKTDLDDQCVPLNSDSWVVVPVQQTTSYAAALTTTRTTLSSSSSSSSVPCEEKKKITKSPMSGVEKKTKVSPEPSIKPTGGAKRTAQTQKKAETPSGEQLAKRNYPATIRGSESWLGILDLGEGDLEFSRRHRRTKQATRSKAKRLQRQKKYLSAMPKAT